MTTKPFFTPEARAAGLKARQKNAALRAKGLLPPIKRKGAPTSFPLDAIPPLPARKKYTKKPQGNEAIAARLIGLLERLL